jgi:hypothetical protein
MPRRAFELLQAKAAARHHAERRLSDPQDRSGCEIDIVSVTARLLVNHLTAAAAT